VPLVSSNPKLGTSLGAMVGYIRKFDAVSEPSLLAVQAQRSNTSSRTLGLGAKAYWNQNRDQLQFGIVGGNVSNDHLDFLGTGQEVRSEENLRGYFLRYQHRVWRTGSPACRRFTPITMSKAATRHRRRSSTWRGWRVKSLPTSV